MTTDTDIFYETQTARARLRIPAKHDPMKIHDYLMKALWPEFDPERPDPVFNQIMKDRELRAAEEQKTARKARQEKKSEQRDLLG